MTRIALVLALLAASILPAGAQQMMLRNPDAVLNVARGFGSAQMEPPDHEGRPFMTGMIDGTRYGVLMYGCEADTGCDSVQFFASFETNRGTPDFLNQWNLDKRYASAYREDDGSVVLNYSANIDGGVTQDNFIDTFDIWVLLLGQFVERLEAGNK